MSNYRNFAYDELVYCGRILEVHRVGLRVPGGTVVPRDFVHYGGAAVVLPVLGDGSMVLIRNVRFAADELLWELPAGMIDPGESPDACAARELAEETGFSPGKLVKLGQFFSAPGTSDEILHAYLATELASGPQGLEEYEDIKVETLAADQVRRMVADGTIRDAKTIATLALYWLRAGER